MDPQRIVGKATKSRQEAGGTVIYKSGAVPPSGWTQNDNGFPVAVSNPPRFEGQVTYFRPNGGAYANMYVVVNINGELTWKLATAVSVFRDTRTEQEYDPMRTDFYR